MEHTDGRTDGRTLEQLQSSVVEKALPLSEKVLEAFYEYPRHTFLPEYSPEQAYGDRPLLLYDRTPFISTISQPSFVLKILDLLKIEPGHKIFELGSGSGWNTSLLSYLVGKEGKVVSMEIIPEMATRAQKALEERHIHNALVVCGDGFEGSVVEAPYDRIIFTAGSTEFPDKLFAQLIEGGWMVYVHKKEGQDVLEVIQKREGHSHVMQSIPCYFVPVVRSKESRPLDGTPS